METQLLSETHFYVFSAAPSSHSGLNNKQMSRSKYVNGTRADLTQTQRLTFHLFSALDVQDRRFPCAFCIITSVPWPLLTSVRWPSAAVGCSWSAVSLCLHEKPEIWIFSLCSAAGIVGPDAPSSITTTKSIFSNTTWKKVESSLLGSKEQDCYFVKS